MNKNIEEERSNVNSSRLGKVMLPKTIADKTRMRRPIRETFIDTPVKVKPYGS